MPRHKMKTLTIESKKHGTHHVLLDDEDYDRVVAEGKWYIHKAHRRAVFYVERKAPKDERGKQKVIALHRFIMDAPRGKMVDHINGDGRDNRKENLRICTVAENARNCNTPPRGVSGYYGVIYRTRKGYIKRYMVNSHDPRWRTGSMFFTAEEAAMEYDKLAKEHHGEFATLNFPDGVPPDVMQKIIAGQKEYEKIRTRHPAEKQSKQKGVTWEKRCNRWRVYLGTKYLGRFKTEEEAIAARLRAERELAEE
jgi:hypothetical protein